MGQVLHGSGLGIGHDHGVVCLGVVQPTGGDASTTLADFPQITAINTRIRRHGVRGLRLLTSQRRIVATRRADLDARESCRQQRRRRSGGPSVPRPYRAPGTGPHGAPVQSAPSWRNVASQIGMGQSPQGYGDVSRMQLRAVAFQLVPVTSLFCPAGPEALHQYHPGEGLAAVLHVVDVRVGPGQLSTKDRPFMSNKGRPLGILLAVGIALVLVSCSVGSRYGTNPNFNIDPSEPWPRPPCPPRCGTPSDAVRPPLSP
jgi:hypothetical protein